MSIWPILSSIAFLFLVSVLLLLLLWTKFLCLLRFPRLLNWLSHSEHSYVSPWIRFLCLFKLLTLVKLFEHSLQLILSMFVRSLLTSLLSIFPCFYFKCLFKFPLFEYCLWHLLQLKLSFSLRFFLFSSKSVNVLYIPLNVITLFSLPFSECNALMCSFNFSFEESLLLHSLQRAISGLSCTFLCL